LALVFFPPGELYEFNSKLSVSWLFDSDVCACSGYRPRSISPDVTSKRVIYHYQTPYYQGKYVFLAKIWKQIDLQTHKPITTDVLVAAFHLGYDSNNEVYIHLNDNVPSDAMFKIMWEQVATLQKNGVSVRMLGGAA
jgi:hypothetical protein